MTPIIIKTMLCQTPLCKKRPTEATIKHIKKLEKTYIGRLVKKSDVLIIFLQKTNIIDIPIYSENSEAMIAPVSWNDGIKTKFKDKFINKLIKTARVNLFSFPHGTKIWVPNTLDHPKVIVKNEEKTKRVETLSKPGP